MENKDKQFKRSRRHSRVRAKIKGTAKRPRLSIYRSNTGMFAQLIDDEKGKTIVSVASREIKPKKTKSEKIGTKIGIGFELGKLLAEKAGKKKISTVVFDRGGHKYHGRIKAVADGARKAGLNF